MKPIEQNHKPAKAQLDGNSIKTLEWNEHIHRRPELCQRGSLGEQSKKYPAFFGALLYFSFVGETLIKPPINRIKVLQNKVANLEKAFLRITLTNRNKPASFSSEGMSLTSCSLSFHPTKKEIK